jgi:hypothetical protein
MEVDVIQNVLTNLVDGRNQREHNTAIAAFHEISAYLFTDIDPAADSLSFQEGLYSLIYAMTVARQYVYVFPSQIQAITRK